MKVLILNHNYDKEETTRNTTEEMSQVQHIERVGNEVTVYLTKTNGDDNESGVLYYIVLDQETLNKLKEI